MYSILPSIRHGSSRHTLVLLGLVITFSVNWSGLQINADIRCRYAPVPSTRRRACILLFGKFFFFLRPSTQHGGGGGRTPAKHVCYCQRELRLELVVVAGKNRQAMNQRAVIATDRGWTAYARPLAMKGICPPSDARNPGKPSPTVVAAVLRGNARPHGRPRQDQAGLLAGSRCPQRPRLNFLFPSIVFALHQMEY